jgi:hypothetical protein
MLYLYAYHCHSGILTTFTRQALNSVGPKALVYPSAR